MKNVLAVVFSSLWLLSCASALSQTSEKKPVTPHVWQEAVVSVTDLDRSAQFFLEIGGYEVKWRGAIDKSLLPTWGLADSAGGEAMLLGPAGYETGLLRLVRFDKAGYKTPTRPGARAWDTGCYFSLMVRMKDMQAIYDDAIRMGWWTETPITKLSFGESRLNVMVFRGPDGVQVQGYERLAPPLSDAIPPFERITGPFNMMQMVRDRDATYALFTDVLGFDTFYKGKPYRDEKPTYMPLGIPINLTTTVAYQAGIVYPVKGEFGRMEMIEMIDLDGRDHAAKCNAPNLGILSVRFPVDDVTNAVKTITVRGGKIERDLIRATLAPYGDVHMFNIKTPDGANVQFFERLR